MEMKAENENDMSKEGGIRSHRFGIRDGENGAASEFTSTFQSLDLPPKEYEQQLQQYESEVRNHIKVEQQLKLHIEVLQEKIDELEQEREKVQQKIAEKVAEEKR